MATQKTTVVVDVVDNGSTEKLNQQAQKTHKSFKDLAKTAANIVTSGISSGITAGAQKAMASSQPKGSGRLMSETEYNAARGTAGVTGASARDFAKQSEGLSGLVRLYAVYAANIYAAGAAFTALSNAMDTTNMVKGLDQLGAASGKALGSLAKDFVKATDGAASLRESMEAVAKASSSGMSSEQILRMGKAAQQASQALGVNMSDAISRITRGITKLEPELLDELGIFIRVDDVTKEYAKSVGKAASELTDFERRQAYANAVLDQADKKFSAIDIDTNPYTKLAAALTDLAQKGLELVNKVLAPLIGYLAESPTALSMGMAAIVGIIVKQAIPAITQFSESITNSAREAVKASTIRLTAVKDAIDKESAVLKAASDANAEIASANFIKATEDMEARYAASTKRANKFAKEMRDILALPPSEIIRSPEMMATIDKYVSKNDPTKGVGKDYAAAQQLLLEYKREEEDYIATSTQLALEKDRKLKQAEANYYNEKKSNLQAISASEIRAQAAQTASMQSLGQAFKGLTSNVLDSIKGLRSVAIEIESIDANGKRTTKTITEMVPKISLLGAATMFAGGAFAAIGSSIMKAFGTLAPWLEIIGLVTVAIGFFDSYMSKATEQLQKFDDSLKRTEGSAKTLNSTLESLYARDASTFFSAEALTAQANAVLEVSNSFKTLTKDTASAQKAVDTSPWDKLKNSIFSAFGGGVQKNFEKNVSNLIKTSVEGIESGPLKREVSGKIAGILGVSDVSNVEDLQKALKGLAPSSEKIALIEKVFKDTALSAGNAASKAEEFKESIKKTETAYKTFADQFKVKDPLTQLAQAQSTELLRLDSLLSGPVTESLSSVRALLSSPESASLFADNVQDVLKYKGTVDALNVSLVSQEKKLKDLADKEKALGEARDVAEAKRRSSIAANDPQGVKAAETELKALNYDKQIADIRAERGRVENSIDKSKSELQKIFANIQSAIPAALSKQVSYIEAGIVAAMAKGSTQFAQTVLGMAADMTGSPELVRQQTQLKVQEIGIQQRLIQSNLDLITQLKINAAEAAVNTAAIALASLKSQPTDQITRGQISQTEKELTEAQNKLRLTKLASTDPAAAARELKSGTTPGGVQGFEDISSLASQVAGLKGEIGQLAQQVKSEILQGRLKEVDVEVSGMQKRLTMEAESVRNSEELLEQSKQKQAISAEEYAQERITLVQRSTSLVLAQDLVKAGQDYAKGMIVVSELAKQGKADEAEKARAIIEQNYATATNLAYGKRSLSLSKETIALIDQKYAAQEKERNQLAEIARIRVEGANAALDAESSVRQVLNETAKTTGMYTAKYQAEQDAMLKSNEIRAKAERDQQALSTDFTIKSLALQAEARKLEEQGAGPEEIGKVRDKLQAEVDAYKAKTLAILTVRDTELSAIKQIEDARKQQTGFDQLAQGVLAFNAAIEGMGTALSEAVISFKELTATQAAHYNTIRELAAKEAKLPKGSKEQIKVQEELSEAREDAIKADLQGYAKTAGAAKKAFKEKTAAYKVFNALEKTSQAISLALELKTAAVKVATWMGLIPAKAAAETAQVGIEATAAAAKAPITFAEIVGNYAAKLPPPMGLAAGLAAGALFLSLLGKSGGSSKSAFVPTAEQRQETQGTAMGWNSEGAKVQVSRGVFGDTDAKSESISKSLEVIEATSVEGLDYNNQMLQALRQIRDNIGKAAISLYGISGLRAGSLSGITEGTNTSGGLLGIGGLFSKSTTKTIVDSGIKLAGTFGELIKGVNGTIQTFETVSTTVKKSGVFGIGGSTKTRISTKYQDLLGLDPKAFKALQTTFDNAADLILSIADSAGYAADKVSEQLMAIPVDEMISLRGLKGEDFTKELSAVIGKVLDDASLAIFKEFEQFAKFGEGMLEAVVRVIDTNKKVTQSLENSGIDLAATIAETGAKVDVRRSGLFGLFGFTKTITSFAEKDLKELSYKITERLVELAGGLQEFLDAASFFQENFLTEAERLEPTTKAVTKELARLAAQGYTSADGLVDTREEFKALVQSLNLTTESGQNAYTALMRLAPGFDQMIKPAEELAASIKSERDSLELELEKAKLLGDTTALRELEISKLDESNRAIKREIYYLEDLAKARDDAINKLGSLVSTFRDFAKQVSTFKTSLLLGSTSTATPLEKFATAQTEFETAYRNALAGDKDAMSKLTSSANTYLDLAKTVFASSTEYSNIFSSVVDKLTTAESVATTTADTAELQLNALKDQTILLQNIDAGIAKLAGIAAAPIQTAATGGWRQGITLVGEEGPELVDFKTPARVYTANQTEGMFNVPSAAVNQQQALIAEVQALRKEVVKLREQQRTETGHLINATYDAQTRNADIITDELAANISRAAWKQQVSQTAVVK